jgi:hypothetical protein
MTNKENDLKLVYVLKVGTNSKGEGLYEFIFCKDTDAIMEMQEQWMWDETPASNDDNAEPPTPEYVDKILELKTDKFTLFCLHESDDHSYMDGVYTIHCLAYESETDVADYDAMLNDEYEEEDAPILVFHYGMTLKQVEGIFYERDIILKESTPQHI